MPSASKYELPPKYLWRGKKEKEVEWMGGKGKEESGKESAFEVESKSTRLQRAEFELKKDEQLRGCVEVDEEDLDL